MSAIALAVAVCLLLYLALLAALVLAGRGRHATAYARLVPDALSLFARLMRDPALSQPVKLLIAAALAYLTLPFDLVPDFIPVVGLLDDALMVALVLRVVLRAAGPGLVHNHWRGPPETLRLVLHAAGA